MSKMKVRFVTALCLVLLFIVLLYVYSPATHVNAPASVAPGPLVECAQENKAIRAYYSTIDSVPDEVVRLMTKFPKGGDLHNHLSGSVMPEDYIAIGVKAGYCYDKGSFKIKECSPGDPLLSEAGSNDIDNIKQALSMYHYDYPDIQGGHDHFFATFGKFGAVSGAYQGAMLAKLLEQASNDNVKYVETMMSFTHDAFNSLFDALTREFPDPDDYKNKENYKRMYTVLEDAGLQDAVNKAGNKITKYEEIAGDILHCDSAEPSDACSVIYRFQGEINRNPPADNLPDASVFVQAAINFALSNADERVVAVNLVSGEDLPVSMQEFGTQMDIFSFFHNQYQDVNIALHAGELTPCFVGEDNPALFSHLSRSLDAGATRIGHGISFEYLDDKQRLEIVAEMTAKNALVEVPMTSNAQILGVTGGDHPFSLYFRLYDVPVAFATDDEGVSYNNFTNEWVYAWRYYNLSMEEMITLARNSLQYSFLKGQPLWTDIPLHTLSKECANDRIGTEPQTAECRAYLNQSQKATVQWNYEIELNDYINKNRAILKTDFGYDRSG